MLEDEKVSCADRSIQGCEPRRVDGGVGRSRGVILPTSCMELFALLVSPD